MMGMKGTRRKKAWLSVRIGGFSFEVHNNNCNLASVKDSFLAPFSQSDFTNMKTLKVTIRGTTTRYVDVTVTNIPSRSIRIPKDWLVSYSDGEVVFKTHKYYMEVLKLL